MGALDANVTAAVPAFKTGRYGLLVPYSMSLGGVRGGESSSNHCHRWRRILPRP